jgi:hypothetical protein
MFCLRQRALGPTYIILTFPPQGAYRAAGHSPVQFIHSLSLPELRPSYLHRLTAHFYFLCTLTECIYLHYSNSLLLHTFPFHGTLDLPAAAMTEATSDYGESIVTDDEYTSVTSSRLQYTFERGRCVVVGLLKCSITLMPLLPLPPIPFDDSVRTDEFAN